MTVFENYMYPSVQLPVTDCGSRSQVPQGTASGDRIWDPRMPQCPVPGDFRRRPGAATDTPLGHPGASEDNLL